MAEDKLPDWTTELDEEILKLLNTELTLTPTVIAENIDRSRGAVSRRLNTLEAGELVKKVSRGKYSITPKASEMIPGGWKLVETSEGDMEKAARAEAEYRKQIELTLGISADQYQEEVSEEYNRLKQDWEGDYDDLLKKAFEIVDQRHRSENNK